MEEEKVSFETAKIAKEKGFMEAGNYPLWYHSNGEEASMFEPLWNITREEYPKHEAILRPTQSLLQKWLREVHNIDIIVSRAGAIQSKRKGFLVSIYTEQITLFPWKINKTGESYFSTYEQALEAGLEKSLKLVKQ